MKVSVLHWRHFVVLWSLNCFFQLCHWLLNTFNLKLLMTLAPLQVPQETFFSLHALSRKPRDFTGFFALLPAGLPLEVLLSPILSYFVFNDCTSLSLAIVQCLLCRMTGSLILDHLILWTLPGLLLCLYPCLCSGLAILIAELSCIRKREHLNCLCNSFSDHNVGHIMIYRWTLFCIQESKWMCKFKKKIITSKCRLSR